MKRTPVAIASVASLLFATPAWSQPVDRPAYLDKPRFIDHERMTGEALDARDPDTILAALDAIPSEPEPPERGDPTEDWKAWHAARLAWRAERANLIAELEASGYDGDRLAELRSERVGLLRFVIRGSGGPGTWWSSALGEIKQRHEGEPIAAKAELAQISLSLGQLNWADLDVTDESLERILELELAAAPVSEPGFVGSVLQSALYPRGKETVAKWTPRLLAELPESSALRKSLLAIAKYGKPYRITGPSLDGGTIDTHDWLGDVVLVDIWGSWCGPCIAGMPKVQEMQAEYGPRGFRVLGVVMDDPDEAVRFLSEVDYDWPHLAPAKIEDAFVLSPRGGYASPVVEELQIRGFPTYLLIDRAGVLHRGGFGDELREKIETLLDEPAD